MISTSVLTKSRLVLFETPDGDTGGAVYRLGRWRGFDRWRGYYLQRCRSRRPYLETADGKVRIPVTIMSEIE
jgi:hypothetical protein